MTALLTRRETQLLHLLAAASRPLSARQLSSELIVRGHRGISDSVVRESLAALTARGLAWKSDRTPPEITYRITDSGRARASLRPAPPDAPGRLPDPVPAQPLPPPPGIRAGEVWAANRPRSGRRILITSAGADVIIYRVLSQAPGVARGATAGRMRPSSLTAAYHREKPAVHLMITDPDDPDFEDIFARCCGVSWMSLIAQGGMITGRRELVTCPGRAVAH